MGKRRWWTTVDPGLSTGLGEKFKRPWKVGVSDIHPASGTRLRGQTGGWCCFQHRRAGADDGPGGPRSEEEVSGAEAPGLGRRECGPGRGLWGVVQGTGPGSDSPRSRGPKGKGSGVSGSGGYGSLG